MAFADLDKPGRIISGAPMISLGQSGRAAGQTYLSLNSAALRALGEPAAIRLAWDADQAHLAVIICSPDDPRSYTLTSNGRASVTQIMRKLGISVTETTRHPARPHGRTGLVIDMSELPTASTYRRGAA